MPNLLPIRLAAGSGPTFGVDDLACAAATHLGFWRDEGLDVFWTPVHGGVRAVQSVLDGETDVSYGGLGPALKFRAEGAPVRIVVSMALALAQNLVVQQEITDTTQLRGVSWALDGFGALSHHMARLTLRALGISEDEINWEAVGPPPERIERLLAGTIDVSLIRVEEAWSLNNDAGNTLHTLLGFAELKEMVPLQPHGVLATTEEYERTHGEELHRLTRGMIRASRALHDDLDAFEKTFRHQVTIPVPDNAVREIWEREQSTGSFAVDGGLDDAHWEAQMASFIELNPKLPEMNLPDVLAGEYVAKTLDALGAHDG
ncbi:MAG: ABC transporter substrate-binding protein [Pseudomonadota bacterium]|nr:ABC transporter substrate-binding protein [Pseudomonadota bacterium]